MRLEEWGLQAETYSMNIYRAFRKQYEPGYGSACHYPEHGKQKQVDHYEFTANLIYIIRIPGQLGLQCETLSPKKCKKTQREREREKGGGDVRRG